MDKKAVIRKEESVVDLLLKSSKVITSEVELEKLVQRVTDIGTELTGAAFGAFFYNVENASGEKYVLYTISGVPKEAFSKFPMPRNTKIFSPTFSGEKIVRFDDVTQESHYGKSAPHFGMPKGHLPVKSYLAAPVVSALNGEVIGGLFFGHPDPGVFDTESETLIEGIAAQAAVAMANARLFEEKKNTEKRLRERSDQYKSIFESAFDAIIIFDLEGNVIETNQASLRLFGYPASVSMKKLHGSRLFADHQFHNISELVRTGRKYTGQTFIKTLQSATIHVELNVSSFAYGDQPHMLAVLSPLPDAESKKTIEEIQAFSDVIASTAPVALWMTNMQGETIYVNQTWVDWTGSAFNEQLGKGWMNAIIEEDRLRAADEFTNALKHRKILEVEFRVLRADGRIIWCLTNGNPFFSKEGDLMGYAGSCMDITERKLFQEKLHSRNVLINTITNNTLQALFMMDDRQFCTYMNPAAEQMTGYELKNVQEKPLHYYIHHTHPDGRHFPIEECPIDRALPERMQTQGEDVFIHKDGHFYDVSFTASPIIENGIPKGTVIEVRDITSEKKLAEELKQKEEAGKELLERKVKERTAELEKINYELLQFTSVASHDLKEPLRKISVFSKLLRDRSKEILTDPTLKKYIDQVIHSSGRMTKLIEDLLVFSKLSQQKEHFQMVDLSALLREIVSDLEIAMHEKNASVRFEDLPMVKGISIQLGQVFQNLISNSLKFSDPKRSPEISIKSEVIERNQMQFHRIVYTDNGIGFNNEYAEKIFDIFQRLHSKDAYEGTGVGLAIVKKIVALHGGEVRAHSFEGKGSTFEILLPS